MKRILYTITLFLFTITLAHANILSDAAAGITGWVINNALATVIAAVFMLIGAFWGTTAWGKMVLRAKLPITEAKDVLVKVHAARQSSSPGGKSITDAEKDAILKEVEDVIAAIITAFGPKTPTP